MGLNLEYCGWSPLNWLRELSLSPWRLSHFAREGCTVLFNCCTCIPYPCPVVENPSNWFYRLVWRGCRTQYNGEGPSQENDRKPDPICSEEWLHHCKSTMLSHSLISLHVPRAWIIRPTWQWQMGLNLEYCGWSPLNWLRELSLSPWRLSHFAREGCTVLFATLQYGDPYQIKTYA